jgi:hypothetical protein
MSRNSKNATRKAQAKAITALHLKGEKGPARTSPSHGKKWGYRDNPEVLKRIAEAIKAANVEEKNEKTAGKKILRGAGKASAPVQVAR